MKLNLPVSKDCFNFFDSKHDKRLCIGIDGIPFFADVIHCSFSFPDNSIICCFKIDCEVNSLNET